MPNFIPLLCTYLSYQHGVQWPIHSRAVTLKTAGHYWQANAGRVSPRRRTELDGTEQSSAHAARKQPMRRRGACGACGAVGLRKTDGTQAPGFVRAPAVASGRR